jgi:hypothetical protein
MAGAVHTLWFGATAEAQVVASARAGASCAGRGQEAEKEDLPLEHFPLHLSFPKLKQNLKFHSRRVDPPFPRPTRGKQIRKGQPHHSV